MLVADANRIALLGDAPACDARVLASYDFASHPLSSVTLGPCSAFTPWALALAPDGAAVAAGSFSAPFDFSTGTKLAPRGADAFVVELSR